MNTTTNNHCIDATPVALNPSPDGRKWTLSHGPGIPMLVADEQLASVLSRLGEVAIYTTDAQVTYGRLGSRHGLVAGLFCLSTMHRILTNQASPSGEKKPEIPDLWAYLAKLGFDPSLAAGNRTVRLPDAYRLLRTELEKADLLPVFELEHKLLPVTNAMRRVGIGIDRPRMETLRSDTEMEQAEAADALKQVLNRQALNVDSNDELLAALRAAGLAISSTKKSAIEHLFHPAVGYLLDYRAAVTALRAIKQCLDNMDDAGRIHATWDPVGTSTGRYTCANPPFQGFLNKREFLFCLVPAPGKAFIRCDLSGADLRPLAYASGDQTMIAALQTGMDFHKQTAALVCNKSVDEVTTDERTIAKKVIFGLVYGQGPESMASELSRIVGQPADLAYARSWIDAVLDRFPGLREWREKQKRLAASATEVRTLSLHRRALLPAGKEHVGYRFRQLVNHPAQGTIADAIKQAMIEIHAKLPVGAHLIANRHDELIVECPGDEAQGVKLMLAEAMKSRLEAMIPNVPVVVETKLRISLAG